MPGEPRREEAVESALGNALRLADQEERGDQRTVPDDVPPGLETGERRDHVREEDPQRERQGRHPGPHLKAAEEAAEYQAAGPDDTDEPQTPKIFAGLAAGAPRRLSRVDLARPELVPRPSRGRRLLQN